MSKTVRNAMMLKMNIEGATYKEIANEYGISVQRVQQIISKEVRMAISKFCHEYPYIGRRVIMDFIRRYNDGRGEAIIKPELARDIADFLTLKYDDPKRPKRYDYNGHPIEPFTTALFNIWNRKGLLRNLYDKIGGFTIEEVI